MINKQPTLAQREKFIEDLERTFQAALEGGNFPAAVKAKELQAKKLGFFDNEATKKISLKDLNAQDLQRLLTEIESHAFKHVPNLKAIKKEIKDLQKALEERDRLEEIDKSSNQL